MEDMFVVKENCLFVLMPQELDHKQADEIRMKADEYLLNGKAQNVIFDFEKTDFMDSSGIGVIVGRYKKASCMGGRVVAIHVNPRILRILSMSGLKDIVDVV